MPKQRTNTLRLLTIVVLLVFLASGRSPLFCEGPQAVYGATAGAAAPVQLMRQMPELPNGCEVTSLAMMLGAAGYPIDNVTLYQRYLPKQALLETADMRYSGSPEAVYVGNAADVDDGWYCFEQPIIAAGDAWLAEADSALRMVRLSGLDEKQLLRYAKAVAFRLGDAGLSGSCARCGLCLDAGRWHALCALHESALCGDHGRRERFLHCRGSDFWLALCAERGALAEF